MEKTKSKIKKNAEYRYHPRKPNMWGTSLFSDCRRRLWPRGTTNKNEYKSIYVPYPYPRNVAEHRFIMERYFKKYLGRYLSPKEVVHHINKKRKDNRIENLMVFKNGGYHCAFHRYGHCNPKAIIFDGRGLGTNKARKILLKILSEYMVTLKNKKSKK